MGNYNYKQPNLVSHFMNIQKVFFENVVVVEGQLGRHFVLDVGYIVGQLNYSRCDTNLRIPCTITPFH